MMTAAVGDREWNHQYRDHARDDDPFEQGLHRLYSARKRGEISTDDLETMQRIMFPPRPGWHAWQRPLWTRW